MSSTVTVTQLPVDERPRERLLAHGAENISAQELVAIVLGRGAPGHSVMTIAQELLRQFGSLSGVVSASVAELQTVAGLGPAKALQLKSCLEIAHRVSKAQQQQEQSRQQDLNPTNPQAVSELVRSVIRDWHKEQFFVISLDARQRIVGMDRIGMGTINANLVHPRETFETALRSHATALIVAHNHPSGDPEPSDADVVTTQRLAAAGEIMGIELLDHVIVTQTQAFSFSQQKKL